MVVWITNILLVLFLVQAEFLAGVHCCPTGWQDAIGVCYMQMQVLTEFVPWSVANYLCTRMDPRAHLPIFKDPLGWSVFQMGVKQFKSQFASVTPPPGFELPCSYAPFGAYKKDGKFYWVDGTEIALGTQYWQVGQPNGTSTNPLEAENCIGFNLKSEDTGYSDIPCQWRFGYVCQMEGADDPPPKPNEQSRDVDMVADVTPVTCPKDWSLANNACYKVPADPVAAIADGGKLCTQLNPDATLPQFHSAIDFRKFLDYFGKEVVPAQHLDVALFNKKAGDIYPLKDGKAYFTNWDVKPTDVGTKECVIMNDIFGYAWRTADCTAKAFIVCQLDTRKPKGDSSSSNKATGGADGAKKDDKAAEKKGNGANNNKSDWGFSYFVEMAFVLFLICNV